MSRLGSWGLPALETQRSVSKCPVSTTGQCAPVHITLRATDFCPDTFSEGKAWNTETPANTNDHNSDAYTSKNPERMSVPYTWGWCEWYGTARCDRMCASFVPEPSESEPCSDTGCISWASYFTSPFQESRASTSPAMEMEQRWNQIRPSKGLARHYPPRVTASPMPYLDSSLI